MMFLYMHCRCSANQNSDKNVSTAFVKLIFPKCMLSKVKLMTTSCFKNRGLLGSLCVFAHEDA